MILLVSSRPTEALKRTGPRVHPLDAEASRLRYVAASACDACGHASTAHRLNLGRPIAGACERCESVGTTCPAMGPA